MLDYFGKLNKNIIDQIRYRGTMVTGVITADNGDGTYAVKIAQADEAYPYVETAFPDMVFGVDEVVLITFEYGNKEMPRILGHAKRIAQHPIDVVSDYSGDGGDPITTVETLDAYLVTGIIAYLEARISLSQGTGNCTRRGFRYGTTTSYGLDVHEDGEYGEGAYVLQVKELIGGTTYHYQAYVIDADENEQTGGDRTFVTGISGNLISCDYDAHKIYIHSGLTSTVINSFASPQAAIFGLTYDGGNLISCVWFPGKIYIHSGITSTISSSFDSPDSTPSGLAYDGVNLISCDWISSRIYIHSGITEVTIDDFASPNGDPYGLTYNGSNLISCDDDTHKIYIHSGITSTISSSFNSPGYNPYGLTYDANMLISTSRDTDKIYVHSGVTSTIIYSFDSPSTMPCGLACDN